MKAQITLRYEEEKEAEAIANAVSPDNKKTPSSLSIKTASRGNQVITYMKCSEKIPTLIATIDDLLSCVSVAEKVLRAVRFG